LTWYCGQETCCTYPEGRASAVTAVAISRYAVFNKTKGYDRAGLWLFKYMSPLTPYRNFYGNNVTNADLIDTSDNLALITKCEDLAVLFPGIMNVGAFRRVDNIINGAVVTGLITQRPLFRFDSHVLFENVQRISHDGNGTATNDSAFYMLHMAYDSTVLHNNDTSPVGCIALYPAAAPPNLANQPI
jgi:hypothetical protein